MPIKHPCGHILEATCVAKWLAPLSEQGSNDCPICRQPVFEIDREVITRRRVIAAFEEYSSNPDVLDLAPANTDWIRVAEKLWIQLCEALVDAFERTADPEGRQFGAEPLVKLIINLTPVEGFVKGFGRARQSQHPRDVWWVRSLVDLFTERLIPLLRHRDEHPAQADILDHDAQRPVMLAPTAIDHLRASGYHPRIRAANARLRSQFMPL